jgi:fucose permease
MKKQNKIRLRTFILGGTFCGLCLCIPMLIIFRGYPMIKTYPIVVGTFIYGFIVSITGVAVGTLYLKIKENKKAEQSASGNGSNATPEP